MGAKENLAAIFGMAIEINGGDRYRVMACPLCQQKNRVDAARVLAEAARPKCGKCGGFLRGPQWDSTEGGPPTTGNPR